STDGGVTWNQLPGTNPASPAVCASAGPSCPWSYVNRLAIAPDGTPNGTTILAGTNNGLWRSADGGNTWGAGINPNAGGQNPFLDVDFDPTNNQRAITGGNNAAFFSTNAGQNWAPATFRVPPNPNPTPVSGRVELAYAPSNAL